MEKWHIHRLTIQYPAQVISFRIYLPRDVHEITGILVDENTIHPGSGPNTLEEKSQVIYSNVQVGKLYLKQCGIANKFFGLNITRNDNSLLYGDFDKLDFFQQPEATIEDFQLHDWVIAGAKWDAFPASIQPQSHILLGGYKDRFIDKTDPLSDPYQVSIYLRYETIPCVPN